MSHVSENNYSENMTIVGVLLLIIPFCGAQSDSSKWVWARNDNLRNVNGEKRYNGELASYAKPLFQANSNYNEDRRFGGTKYRYEVTESTYPPENVYKPQPTYQTRPPDSLINRPGNPYRPPINSIDNYRPSENTYRPIGNGYRPPNKEYYLTGLRPGIGTNGRPILTGPTPSWEESRPPKYRDYDICKCVHSFNCNTPGIKFGSCDVDKQYCCYKSNHNEGHGGSEKPVSSVHDRPRPHGVLAGPGGPVDGHVRPHPDYVPSGRPPYRPDRDFDSDRELNEAYKKGLASAIYELYSRPGGYSDRELQGYREYYPPDRDYYSRPSESHQSAHPSKYGLYYPSSGAYARSANSTIAAIDDSKN